MNRDLHILKKRNLFSIYMTSIYCGINKPKKGQTLGNMKQCLIEIK